MNVIFTSPFFSITESEMDELESVYPGVNVPMELRKADMWLRVNPGRRKRNYRRFYNNWLARTHLELLKSEVHGASMALAKDASVRREAQAGTGPRVR